MFTKDSLLGVGSNVLEDFSSMIVIVNLLLEELREASNILDLSGTRELLDNTNNIAHDILRFIIGCNVRHVLLEYLCELIN